MTSLEALAKWYGLPEAVDTNLPSRSAIEVLRDTLAEHIGVNLTLDA